MTGREWVIAALIVGAPWALVLIVALVRGYAISLHMERPKNRRE